MSDSRKAAVLIRPFPRSVRELRRYLGVNSMRRFIPGYSTLAQPLSSNVNMPLAAWPMEEMRSVFAMKVSGMMYENETTCTIIRSIYAQR